MISFYKKLRKKRINHEICDSKEFKYINLLITTSLTAVKTDKGAVFF